MIDVVFPNAEKLAPPFNVTMSSTPNTTAVGEKLGVVAFSKDELPFSKTVRLAVNGDNRFP